MESQLGQQQVGKGSWKRRVNIAYLMKDNKCFDVKNGAEIIYPITGACAFNCHGSLSVLPDSSGISNCILIGYVPGIPGMLRTFSADDLLRSGL